MSANSIQKRSSDCGIQCSILSIILVFFIYKGIRVKYHSQDTIAGSGSVNLSRTDILSEIKKAEADADAKVAQAEADKKAAIAEARRNSVKKIQDAEAQMRSSYESAVAKESEVLAVKRDEMLAEGKKIAADIEARSEARMQEVRDYLNKEIERTLNVTS